MELLVDVFGRTSAGFSMSNQHRWKLIPPGDADMGAGLGPRSIQVVASECFMKGNLR